MPSLSSFAMYMYSMSAYPPNRTMYTQRGSGGCIKRICGLKTYKFTLFSLFFFFIFFCISIVSECDVVLLVRIARLFSF